MLCCEKAHITNHCKLAPGLCPNRARKASTAAFAKQVAGSGNAGLKRRSFGCTLLKAN